MVAHLNSVRPHSSLHSYLYLFDVAINPSSQEIPTLDRDIIQAHFTIAELKAIDKEFMKRALTGIDFHKSLPMALVCGNPSTPW